jgi:hydrogenase nickel incorporation protein HypB
MCVVCGCGDPAALPPEGVKVDPVTGDLDYGAGAARVSVPGLSQARTVKLEADVLGENDRTAQANRRHFESHGVTALNLVSSPGAGKTTLLVATIEALRRRRPALPLAVIEGDQQTSNDADRIRATGAPAIQVNTGKGCHLDARMVADAFARLPLHDHAQDHPHDHAGVPPYGHAHVHVHRHAHAHRHDGGHAHSHEGLAPDVEHAHAHEHTHAHAHDHGGAGIAGADHDHAHDHASDGHAHAHTPSLLLIENVGNLVCPALWDLGERAKVAILSVTEGDDKPAKYPDMFAAATLMLLNKVDLLAHVDFDVDRCIAHARRINPAIEVLQVSARRGDGMDAWLDWLDAQLANAASAKTPSDDRTPAAEVDALQRRVAELEARLRAAGLAP